MRRAAVTLAAACALIPQAAAAATRYVAPTGADGGACTRPAPCSIAWAINGDGSRAGDTVLVLAGTYRDQPIVLSKPLTVAGPEAGPRPVLRTTGAGGVAFSVTAGAAGAVVSHLAIRATGDGASGIDLEATTALDDVAVRTVTGPCLRSTATGVRIDDSSFVEEGVAADPCLQSSGSDTEWNGVDVSALNVPTAAAFTGNGKVFDSTFEGQTTGLELADKPDAHRVTAIGGQRGISLTGSTFVTDSVAIARAGGSAVFSAEGSHQLLNITAWGEGGGSIGIRATNGAVMSVKNTIARGEAADISADAATTTITADCAVFTGCPAGQITVDHSNFVTAPGITDNGMNSNGAPKFADPAFEDFHLRRGSACIDAGSFEFNSGSADRDGLFRWLGKAPDIGAYEYPPPQRPRPKADRVAPKLADVLLAPDRFRVTRRGSAFAAAAGPPRGTTLAFHVDEQADLVLTVTRPGRGKPVIGTIVRPFRRGAHRMTISGEIGGHFLAPGRYVLHVLARDVAQNLSRERRIAFSVVR